MAKKNAAAERGGTAKPPAIKNRQILILLAIICLSVLSRELHAQRIDSLENQYRQAANDSIQYSILKEIGTDLKDSVKNTAIRVWNRLIEISEKNNFDRGLGVCNYKLGILYISDAQYLQSYNAYQKAIQHFEAANDTYGLAQTHNALGILFKKLNNFEQSYYHFVKSASLFAEMNQILEVGMIYSNLGGMLEEHDSIPQAKKYLEQSKIILEQNNDTNLISCYINLGEVFEEINNTDSAYYYFSKSYELSKVYGDVNDKFTAPYHFAEHLFENNQISRAEKLLNEAYEIFRTENNKIYITLETQASFMELLNEFYASQGDTIKAYNYLTRSRQLEIENKKNASKLELESQEVDRLQQANVMARQQAEAERKIRRIIIYVATIGLLISILLIFTFYRNYKINKKANRLLTEMDQLKTRLFSNITHELRTPLTLILGPLEQILESGSKNAPTRKQVKMIRKNAKSLLELVNQMLDLAKIDAHSLKLELVNNDVAKFIRTRFATFSPIADIKKISYDYQVSEQKRIDFFDASKLEKIINNLISNAIKFTSKGGKVVCSAIFADSGTNGIQITVEDTGKGIPQEEINRIFDRFHQVEDEDVYQIVGTGIGLSLTKELVELMHGSITVSSEMNRGSRFTVNLPLGTGHLKQDEFILLGNEPADAPAKSYEEERFKNEPECKTATEPANANKDLPNVLVADDQTEIREFISENLSDCYSITLAADGKEAYSIATRIIPDLIVTDLLMPRLDGNQLCEKLKTDERTSHIPVVILTGRSSMKERIKGLETGADAYLTKPFNIKELRIRIQKLIEQRKKLRERFTQNLQLEPKDIAVTSADERFINRALQVIEENMSNTEFEVRQLQDEMAMSRMQLFRKIKALTNQTPGEFIRTIRLKRAVRLLEQNFGNIAQITYEVGFNNPSYFAKCFKDLYGKTPSDYIKSQVSHTT